MEATISKLLELFPCSNSQILSVKCVWTPGYLPLLEFFRFLDSNELMTILILKDINMNLPNTKQIWWTGGKSPGDHEFMTNLSNNYAFLHLIISIF